MDNAEKINRIRVLDIARRQAEADRARRLREGMPAKPGAIETMLDPRNPNRLNTNDNE